ncbi:MAG: hypothetical protein PHU85_10800 [Phycisphaerae bacterium]|nr:hypothetical protein [Phycisphaerae bacterium]
MLYYCCANRLNVGDYLSMLGVERLMGLPGRELYMEEKGLFNRRTFHGKLARIQAEDDLLIGGGGLLKDSFERYWRDILRLHEERRFRMCLFGVGTCEPKRPGADAGLPQNIIDAIFDRARIAYIRPPLDRLGAGGKARVTLCPSIGYLADRAADAHSSPPEPHNRLLYVAHARLAGPSQTDRIRTALQDFCKERRWGYDETDNRVSRTCDLTCILGKYEAASHVVTSRLHGYIISRALRKRVVAISADRKIDAFAGQVGDPVPVDSMGFSDSELFRRIPAATAWDMNRLRMANDELKVVASSIRAALQSGQPTP